MRFLHKLTSACRRAVIEGWHDFTKVLKKDPVGILPISNVEKIAEWTIKSETMYVHILMVVSITITTMSINIKYIDKFDVSDSKTDQKF